MAGLIATAMPKLNEIDPKTETVEGRITNLLSADSPLLQDARTRAAQTANSRGLLNSSIAVGEGEKAAMSAALPIAQQDANATLGVNKGNQDATNTFGLEHLRGQQASDLQTQQGVQQLAAIQAQGGTAKDLQQLQGQQALEQQQQRGEQATGLQELTGKQALEQQQLRGTQAADLEQLQEGNRSLLQSNQSAAGFFAQVSTAIGEILKEPNIGVEQKQQLVQKQIELLRNGLAVIGGISNLNLTGLLNFEAPVIPTATSQPVNTPERNAPAPFLDNPTYG